MILFWKLFVDFFKILIWEWQESWYKMWNKANKNISVCQYGLVLVFRIYCLLVHGPPRTSQEVCKSYSNVSVRNVKFLRTQGILPLTVINYNLEMNNKQQHQQEVNRSLCWKIPHMGPFVTDVFRKTPSAELLSRDFHHSLKTVSLGEWGGCEVSMWYNFRYMMLQSATTQIHSYSKQC